MSTKHTAPTIAFPTGQQLASVLQRFGIVDSAAVDDPEGFDNYATLGAINAAAKFLREHEFRNTNHYSRDELNVTELPE